MTNMTRQYSAAASQARNAVDKSAELWTQGARTLTDWLPGLPHIDLIPAVDRYFDFVQRTVEINRHLTVQWAEAAGTLSGMVRGQAESAGNLVRKQAESSAGIVREKAESAERTAREQAAKAERTAREQAAKAERTAREQAAKAERTAREQADQAEQAEKELAREARKAEREQAKQAHDTARERYEGRTKGELTDLLAERELPKSGNIGELIERLVEADSK